MPPTEGGDSRDPESQYASRRGIFPRLGKNHHRPDLPRQSSGVRRGPDRAVGSVQAMPRPDQQQHGNDYRCRRRDEREREQDFESAFKHDSLLEGRFGGLSRKT
jgi:hypothetical protein